MGDADLQVARRRGLREVPQVEGGRRGTRRVVLVGQRRPEHAVQVGALVAERQLQDVAAVPIEDPLRRPDELVQLLDRVVVVVVVDATEPEEDRDRRPELGQELPPAGPDPLVDRGQQPRSNEVLGQGGRLVAGLGLDIDQEATEHAAGAVGVLLAPALQEIDSVAQGVDRRRVEHDLALLGVVLGLGQVVHQAACEHVDQLDVGVPDDEPAGVADGDRHLHPQLDRVPARGHDRARALDRLLHAIGRRARAGAVVAVDPAGDGVAREVDDVAVVRVQRLDDRVEDAPDVGGQLLGATLGAELLGQRLGQRREAADVREQRGPVDAVRQRTAGVERPATVARDVRVGPIAGEVPRGRGRGRWLGAAHRSHCAGLAPRGLRAPGGGTSARPPRGRRR